jgi:ATP-dependent DNA helicase RecG
METRQAPLHQRPIRYVKGVGPQRALWLGQLDIESVEDALYYPPRRYEDRSQLLPIKDLVSGQVATVRATVLSRTMRRARRNLSIVQASLGDTTGVLSCVWFHQPYLAEQLTVDHEFILHGKVEGRGRLQMVHPELERTEGDDDSSLHMARIVPVYPLTSRLGQRWFRRLIATLLEQYAAEAAETLPEILRMSQRWPDACDALRQLHFPDSWELLEAAQRRLAFEELFLLQLVLAQRRTRTAALVKPQHYQLNGPLTDALHRSLPFTLTASQTRVLQELLDDLARPGPMYRLLMGDVGSGKTIVLVCLMAVVVQSGYQAALMAPTELLAEQHARVVSAYLSPLGVRVGLLSQGVDPRQRKQRMAEAAEGTLSVVIGTHALIQRGVSFKRLALAIIDEQHKFGVAQRGTLARKARTPDMLVLTATPIPRTLALSLYGDLNLSVITELPPGRQPVKTVWLPGAERETAYALMREQLAQGHQVYVVYPLVEESASRDLRAATQMAKRLQAQQFADVTVGLLHGQMKPAQKERTMRAFVQGQIHILVSTVIVEVGLDVPNATMMLIEHPERFGLAQLHQLRGRIGRSHHPATCVMISDAQEEGVRHRLQAFAETTDGFELAEKDLELRGPGELLGKRQHGWMRFRIANLLRDRQLLELAREEAEALVARDPQLADPSFAALNERLERFRQHPG